MKIRYPLNRFHPAVFTIVSTLMFGSTGSTTQLSSLGAVDRDPTVGQVVRCDTNTACPKQSYDQHLPELRSRGRTEQSETRLESNVQPPPSRHLIGIADQPCPVAEATLGGLRQSLAVTLPEGSTTRAESLLTVAWTIKAPPPRGPAYLILATEHVCPLSRRRLLRLGTRRSSAVPPRAVCGANSGCFTAACSRRSTNRGDHDPTACGGAAAHVGC